MADEVKQQPSVPATQLSQWRADELRNAMQMFNGRDPNKPVMDMSPNRGAGWLGKR